MKMTEIQSGVNYRFLSFDNGIDLGLYNKMISMGLGVGTCVYASNSDFTGLVTFYVDNIKICIRKTDAKYIEVGEVNE